MQILGPCPDGPAVVKLRWEDEYLETGDGSDDSDCEDSSERVGGPASESQTDRKESVERELLPTLTVGSFTWCVQRLC